MKAAAAALVLLAAAAAPLDAQSPGTAAILGHVSDRTGNSLPGVTVTVSGTGIERRVIADPDGSFSVSDLAPGSYTVVAMLAGFQTVTRSVALTTPGTRTIDLVLSLGCLSEVQSVDLGLPTNITAADAVVYLRIEDAGRPRRLTENDYCIEGHEHRATILTVIKAPALRSDTIRLIRAGSSRYRAGEEYVVFLHSHPSGAFVDFGHDTFRVQDGRVRWTRSDLPGVADGSPLERVLDGLRGTLFMIR